MEDGARFHQGEVVTPSPRTGARVNLAENLERTARARGRSAALTVDDRVTTFAELDRDSRAVAGLLTSRGVLPRDRVGIVLPDVPEFAALYYGVLRVGAIVVPLDPGLAEPEVTACLRETGVRLLVAWSTTWPDVERPARAVGVETLVLEQGTFRELVGDAPASGRLVPSAPGDTAVIQYTAGTTGPPRGAELTHGNLLRNCEVVVNDLLQLTSEDVVFGGLPLAHAFGQTAGLNAAVRTGACLALLPQFEPAAALRTLQERHVTVVQGEPATYAALLGHPRHPDSDLSRLRVGISVGAAMSVGVLLGFEEAFDCLVLEGYGLSEAAPWVSFNRRDHRRVGSVGRPATGVELRVVDDAGRAVEDGEPGEFLVRGHGVMTGYWDRPEDTAAAVVGGWLRTGDVGTPRRRRLPLPDGPPAGPDHPRRPPGLPAGGRGGPPRAPRRRRRRGDRASAPDPGRGDRGGRHPASARPDHRRRPARLRHGESTSHKYPRTVDIVDALPMTVDRQDPQTRDPTGDPSMSIPPTPAGGPDPGGQGPRRDRTAGSWRRCGG